MPDEDQTKVNEFEVFPDASEDWTDDHWRRLLQYLVESGVVNYEEIASATLGHLNPPQVGTSIASRDSFQKHFPPRETWKNVRAWFYEQHGRCIDCGTHLQLQADHIESRAEYGEDADRLENLTLRCRRCNVVRRPSHRKGGITHLTTEVALMWILFKHQPETYQEYQELCRDYGLTMATIRFQEAWARARWLEKSGKYLIDEDSKYK